MYSECSKWPTKMKSLFCTLLMFPALSRYTLSPSFFLFNSACVPYIKSPASFRCDNCQEPGAADQLKEPQVLPLSVWTAQLHQDPLWRWVGTLSHCHTSHCLTLHTVTRTMHTLTHYVTHTVTHYVQTHTHALCINSHSHALCTRSHCHAHSSPPAVQHPGATIS